MCGLILAHPPTHPCVHDCVYDREGATKCVLASVGEMLQHRADLYRLATPVHRGQSASSRKCVYKWGSYFYCFHHFTRSTSSHFFSLYLTLLFWNVLLLFLGPLPSTCFCSQITESVEVSFQKFLSHLQYITFPGLQESIRETCALVFPLSDTLSLRQFLPPRAVPQKYNF